jgi:hypothetical protein
MTGGASLQTLGGFRLSIDGRDLVAPPTQKARAPTPIIGIPSSYSLGISIVK